MEKLSCLYDVPNPTHEQLVAHIASVRSESRAEPINHQLRIAAESAPGATRAAFVKAASEVGYHPNTAGKQFTYSRQLSAEMEAEDAAYLELQKSKEPEMTTTPERQSLIDKIVKLIAKADSVAGTPEEEAFRSKAAQLMADNDISLSESRAKDAFQIYDVDSGRQQLASYETVLLHATAKFCGVAVLTLGKKAYRFVGTPGDLDAFLYMKDLMYNQRSAAWRAYYPKVWGKHPGAKELNKWKNGFALGVAHKIQKLMEASAAAVTERGLVLLPQDKQALTWYEQDNDVKAGRPRKGLKYNPAGYRAGGEVQLNLGLKNDGTEILQLDHK